MTSCKEDDLEVFTQISKEFFTIGSDVDPCLNNLSCWEFDRKFDIVRRIDVVVAVDKCFI